MRSFKTKSYYDVIQGKWEEKYYINNIEVDYSTFDNESDVEVTVESEKLDEMIEDEVSEFHNDEKYNDENCQCDSCEYRDVCDEYEFEEDDDECDEECECECNCENGENKVVNFDQLVSYFVVDILESQGCPECIEESLMEFYDVVSHGIIDALLGDEVSRDDRINRFKN